MKATNINYSIKVPEGAEPQTGTVSMNFPETAEEAIQVWGEEVVLKKCLAQVTIDARRLCYEAENEEQAQEMVNSFTPGIGRERSSSGVSQKALIGLMKELLAKGKTKEEIMAMLQS